MARNTGIKESKMISTSTSTKTYTCPICCKVLNGNKSPQRHLELHEPETKNRFPCPYRDAGCNYASRQRSNLRTHIKAMHDKIFDLPCEHCDYVTTNKASLNHHHRRKHSTIPRSSSRRAPSEPSDKQIDAPSGHSSAYFVDQYHLPPARSEMSPATQALAPLAGFTVDFDYEWFCQQLASCGPPESTWDQVMCTTPQNGLVEEQLAPLDSDSDSDSEQTWEQIIYTTQSGVDTAIYYPTERSVCGVASFEALIMPIDASLAPSPFAHSSDSSLECTRSPFSSQPSCYEWQIPAPPHAPSVWETYGCDC